MPEKLTDNEKTEEIKIEEYKKVEEPKVEEPEINETKEKKEPEEEKLPEKVHEDDLDPGEERWFNSLMTELGGGKKFDMDDEENRKRLNFFSFFANDAKKNVTDIDKDQFFSPLKSERNGAVKKLFDSARNENLYIYNRDDNTLRRATIGPDGKLKLSEDLSKMREPKKPGRGPFMWGASTEEKERYRHDRALYDKENKIFGGKKARIDGLDVEKERKAAQAVYKQEDKVKELQEISRRAEENARKKLEEQRIKEAEKAKKQQEKAEKTREKLRKKGEEQERKRKEKIEKERQKLEKLDKERAEQIKREEERIAKEKAEQQAKLDKEAQEAYEQKKNKFDTPSKDSVEIEMQDLSSKPEKEEIRREELEKKEPEKKEPEKKTPEQEKLDKEAQEAYEQKKNKFDTPSKDSVEIEMQDLSLKPEKEEPKKAESKKEPTENEKFFKKVEELNLEENPEELGKTVKRINEIVGGESGLSEETVSAGICGNKLYGYLKEHPEAMSKAGVNANDMETLKGTIELGKIAGAGLEAREKINQSLDVMAPEVREDLVNSYLTMTAVNFIMASSTEKTKKEIESGTFKTSTAQHILSTEEFKAEDLKSSVGKTFEAVKLKKDVSKLKEATSGGPANEAMLGSRTFKHALHIVGEEYQKKTQAPVNQKNLENQNKQKTQEPKKLSKSGPDR